MPVKASFQINSSQPEWRIYFSGNWTVTLLEDVDALVRDVHIDAGRPIVLDLTQLEEIDTAGAWVIYRFNKRASDGRVVTYDGVRPEHQTLLEVVAEHEQFVQPVPQRAPRHLWLLDKIGSTVHQNFMDFINSIGFFGKVLSVLRKAAVDPKRLRGVSLVHHVEHAGFDALPIVVLISFLIGAVLAFMGADLLRDYGLEVFTESLITHSFMREFGVMLTAIMVAGRSGSSFTAQIGSMKANEEIDAIRSLGLDPIELLVVPRVLALILSLPLLTFIATVSGIVGGGVVAWMVLDVSPAMFVAQMKASTDMNYFYVGLIKSPFMAAVIGIIACYQGMRVSGTSESIGVHTTNSVVQSIFAVITVDAMFALFFLRLGI
jgi:phospholipid/cholesterol/gamma-HCH transport system permease protein